MRRGGSRLIQPRLLWEGDMRGGGSRARVSPGRALRRVARCIRRQHGASPEWPSKGVDFMWVPWSAACVVRKRDADGPPGGTRAMTNVGDSDRWNRLTRRCYCPHDVDASLNVTRGMRASPLSHHSDPTVSVTRQRSVFRRVHSV